MASRPRPTRAEEAEIDDTLSVRDHSQPCEHGRLWSHWNNVTKARWWQAPDCVGGKEIALRRLEDGKWVLADEDPATRSTRTCVSQRSAAIEVEYSVVAVSILEALWERASNGR